jgi:molecular chaperone DnaJ
VQVGNRQILQYSFSGGGRFDIFSQLFQGNARAEVPRKGEDLEYQVSMGFDEALRGLQTRITYARRETCQTCHGKGQGSEGRARECALCQGTGRMAQMKGRMKFTTTCTQCGGSGRAGKACGTCHGDGRVPTTDNLEIKIPPGVQTGSRIRFAGKGDAGVQGAPAGDLYIVTTVGSHPFFERIGDNVYCKVPITLAETALRGRSKSPPLTDVTAQDSSGTQYGQKFRLERGFVVASSDVAISLLSESRVVDCR